MDWINPLVHYNKWVSLAFHIWCPTFLLFWNSLFCFDFRLFSSVVSLSDFPFHRATLTFACCLLFYSHLPFRDEISFRLHTPPVTFQIVLSRSGPFFTISSFTNPQSADEVKLSSEGDDHSLHMLKETTQSPYKDRLQQVKLPMTH